MRIDNYLEVRPLLTDRGLLVEQHQRKFKASFLGASAVGLTKGRAMRVLFSGIRRLLKDSVRREYVTDGPNRVFCIYPILHGYACDLVRLDEQGVKRVSKIALPDKIYSMSQARRFLERGIDIEGL